MNDRDLLELIASQVEELAKRLTTMEVEIWGIKSELEASRNIYIKTKDKYQEELSALHDGLSESSQLIRRIESKLSNQEEIILRRMV